MKPELSRPPATNPDTNPQAGNENLPIGQVQSPEEVIADLIKKSLAMSETLRQLNIDGGNLVLRMPEKKVIIPEKTLWTPE